MFHSHSYEEKVFGYFATFLTNVIDGNSNYEDLVYPIISDAHALAIGNKNFYKIDREGYPVIVYLVETEKNYFEGLDINNLNKANYEHILNLVTKQRPLFAF